MVENQGINLCSKRFSLASETYRNILDSLFPLLAAKGVGTTFKMQIVGSRINSGEHTGGPEEFFVSEIHGKMSKSVHGYLNILKVFKG